MTDTYLQALDTTVSLAGKKRGSPYQRFLLQALNRYVAQGRITFVLPNASIVIGRHYPADADPGRELVVHVHDPDFFRKVACYGNLGMGESYMAGDFSVEENRLPELLTLLLKSGLTKKLHRDVGFVLRYMGVWLLNALSNKATNVQRHYDIGDELFDVFLEDEFQVYSCGYAYNRDDDIATLQHNKLDRICRKLDLRPGQQLLDIGSGNGGLLLHAARHYGVIATGVTNSKSHYRRTLRNIEAHGLGDRVSVHFGDYSEVPGEYDRVVSVGMLEHLPPRDYAAYFSKIASVLRPHGWCLVHAIGLNAANNNHDPFIQKYIFPGSDTPRLSAMAKQIETNDLAILDVENIARHYAVTTQRWLESFRRNSDQLPADRYDTTFKRMWEYYLSCGTAAALAGDLAVYQVLFTNDYHADYRLQRV